MQRASIPVLVTTGLALWSCISAPPAALSDDNPANPKAPAGFVDEPTAIAGYKNAAELGERAATEAKAPPAGMANMPGMSGMSGMGTMNMGTMAMPSGNAARGAKPK
jgi:hypothetical protein